MIVSENNVSTALAYLAEDPHPTATARYDLTIAENLREALYAELYLAVTGTVGEREAQVRSNAEYQALKAEEAKAERELERHKARTRAAEMLIDVFRTEAANVRASEKIR